MTDRYAVVGNPIAHSKSPEIHAAFARQTGHDIDYSRLLAPLDGFRSTIESFRAAGGKGVNVTVPFKLEAFDLADDVSQRAREAEAANFLRFDDARIRADNTDGVGLTRDIVHNLGFGIADNHEGAPHRIIRDQLSAPRVNVRPCRPQAI